MMTKNNKTLDYYMGLPYRLEIVPDTEEGGFTAYYPELPGCATCGETKESVLANAMDAKKVWLTAALAECISIAEPKNSGEDCPETTPELAGRFHRVNPRRPQHIAENVSYTGETKA